MRLPSQEFLSKTDMIKLYRSNAMVVNACFLSTTFCNRNILFGLLFAELEGDGRKSLLYLVYLTPVCLLFAILDGDGQTRLSVLSVMPKENIKSSESTESPVLQEGQCNDEVQPP